MQTASVIDARGMVKGRKGDVVKAMCALIREHELDYEEFNECAKIARERMELVRPGRKPVVKPVPSMDQVKKFMGVIERASTTDALMMKLLLILGIRSVELVSIRIADLDLTPGAERIFARRKGGRDKVFAVPTKIAGLLRMYVEGAGKQVYLFESEFHKPYTTRGIRMKIQRYREKAGIGDVIHAHNFRHLILTLLAAEGWSDSELQLVSGHDSRTSLDRYLHNNPEMIREKLHKALDAVLPGV